MENKIIIISGKKQSGKSSARAFLTSEISKGYGIDGTYTEWYNPVVNHYSFADELKRLAIELFNLSEKNVYGTNEEKDSPTHIKWSDLPMQGYQLHDLRQELWTINGVYKNFQRQYVTGREFLKIFGTYICRRIYPDCWVLATINKIRKTKQDYAIIDDARFPNEIKLLYNEFKDNCKIIRLERNIFNDSDITETALDDFDFKSLNSVIIDNSNMSIEEKNQTILNKLKENNFYARNTR
jgi:hypothetical protein